MPPTDDPMAALLAPENAEALGFMLEMAYAAGWSDAFIEQPIQVADLRIAQRIEQAAMAWQARIAQRWVSAPPEPEWLRQAREAHEGTQDDTARP